MRGGEDYGDVNRPMAESLSHRERQILVYAAAGLTDQAIANKLNISRATVTTYWGRIRTKFGPYGRTELVANYVKEQTQSDNKELLASEALFRGIAEFSPFGIFFADPEVNCLYVNPAWERIAGVPKEAAMGHEWERLIHPDDRAVVGERWKEAIRTGELHDSTSRYLRPDGSVVWVRATAVARREEGRLLGYIGMIEDITEARVAEQMRLEAEQRYLDVIQRAPQGILRFDRSLRVIEANPAAAKLFGYGPHELQGVLVESLVPEEAREQHSRLIQAFLDSDQVSVTIADGQTIAGLTKSGSTIRCEASIIRQNVSGEMQFTLMLRDVTERYEALALLRTSEAKYRGLVESVPQFVWIMRGDGELVEINSWGETYFGVPVEHVLGREWLRYVHPNDVDSTKAAWRAVNSNRTPFVLESRLRRHDGAYRWHLSRGSFIEGVDGECLWLGVTLDIQAQREVQQEREALATVLESTPDLIVTHAGTGEIEFANAAVRLLCGHTPKRLDEVFEPATVEAILEAEHVPQWIGEGFALRDGEPAVPVSIVQVRQSSGDLFSLIARDVAQLRATEAKRAELDAFSKKLADSALDFVYIYNLADGSNVFASASCDSILGYTVDEVLAMGSRLTEIIVHPDDLDLVLGHRARLAELADHGVLEYEFRLVRPNGLIRWLNVRATPFTRHPNGSVAHVLAVAQDVTEQRDALSRLEARVERESEVNLSLSHALLQVQEQLEAREKDLDSVVDALSTEVLSALQWIGKSSPLSGETTPFGETSILRRVTGASRNLESVIEACRILLKTPELVKIDVGARAARIFAQLSAQHTGSPVLDVPELLQVDSDPEVIDFILEILIAESLLRTGNLERPVLALAEYRSRGGVGFSFQDNRILVSGDCSSYGIEAPSDFLRHVVRRLVNSLGGEIWSEPLNHQGCITRVTLEPTGFRAPHGLASV